MMNSLEFSDEKALCEFVNEKRVKVVSIIQDQQDCTKFILFYAKKGEAKKELGVGIRDADAQAEAKAEAEAEEAERETGGLA